MKRVICCVLGHGIVDERCRVAFPATQDQRLGQVGILFEDAEEDFGLVEDGRDADDYVVYRVTGGEILEF